MALVCGIDEAGRGSLAGSLFIACVLCDSIFLESLWHIGVKDSKKLSFKTRMQKADSIKEYMDAHNGFYKIVSYSAQDIDAKGLSQCMQRGLQALKEYALRNHCTQILFDGNTSFGIKGIETLVKGDSKHALIAAASILAKSSKDSEMLDLHERYPHYDFKNNKGYLTKAHIAAIAQYGYTEIHRKSYHIKDFQRNIFSSM